MSKQGVANTALGAAVFRLIEQYEPEEMRLFTDPVVKNLLGPSIRWLVPFAAVRKLTINRTEAMMGKGVEGCQICRTRFIDDSLQSALSAGMKQVVILGAGFDTRPYRISGMDRVKVFEVDLPEAQQVKKKQLQKHFGRLPDNVTFLPIDFDTQTLDTAFAGTNFDASVPTFFIWEAVTQYLTAEAVRQTLTFVGNSAADSMIVFTYVLKGIIERRPEIPDAAKMMDYVAKSSPWIFGLEPSEVKDYLQQFHLKLLADVGNAYYQEKYLRPLKRTLFVAEGERIVQAVVTPS